MAVATDLRHDPFRMIIGGEDADGSAGTYEVVNPATEEVVGVAPEASAQDAQRAAAAAKEAFTSWSRTTPQERARLLDRAADLMEARRDEFVPLIQAETGSTVAMAAGAQIISPIDRLRRYARGALEPLQIPMPPTPQPASPLGHGGLMGAVVNRLPVGVVACITSYNVPLSNVMGKVAPALAMGNTVVIKPAQQDPLAVIRMIEILREAGFPPGTVNLVVGSGPTAGEALVASPDVDMVSFTGSTVVGMKIAEAAGRDMKRTLFELGGKGASLVFDSADLDKAAMGTATTWSFHAGQICTAPTRLIAQRKVYDQLVEKLSRIAGVLRVGDPTRPDTVVGPVISGVQRDRVEGYVASGGQEGGTVVAGGKRPDLDKGFFVAPTLIADCKPGMKVVQEEIFGPVVVAMPFDDEEEGIALANSTDFGLNNYVWSGDTEQAYRVAPQLRSGHVIINSVGRNLEAPFGGFKKSGIGRDWGSFALHAYSELQSVVWPG